MKLNIYSSEQEENINIRRQAETWQRSGLISEEQLLVIRKDADLHLHQTNVFFRILFFVFTLLCSGAVVGLLIWMLEDKAGEKTLAAMVLFFSIACFILAQYIVKARKLYRYGIEEALLLVGMVCFVISLLILTDNYFLNHRVVATMTCLLFSILACLIYLRFGYLYAALISVVALCGVPFQFSLSPVAERLILLGILCGIFAAGLIADRQSKEDFKKERNITIQAGLLAAIYLTVNLHIVGVLGLLMGDGRILHFYPRSFPAWIYWPSYVLTLIIPICGIYWGIQSRKRLILNASLVMTCVTLATNKSYLGLTRYAWDPAILGIVLIGLSLGLIRWLNSGPDKKRHGFTARDILKPEDHGVNLADVAAALTPGAVDAQQSQTPQDKYFEGGRSGGGGAAREF